MILQELFLALVQLGIGTGTASNLTFGRARSRSEKPASVLFSCSNAAFNASSSTNWNALEELATEQGLSAVLVDGIEQLPEGLRPPKLVLLQWIGEALNGYEYRYDQYCKTIAELAAFYNGHGFKMMLLKGYACSMDWPKPEHRPCGDIDIWLFGKQKEADEAIDAWFKFSGSKERVDKDHFRHTIFEWGDFTVENHYDFANVRSHKQNRELEKVFKELGEDDSYSTELLGEKVYLASPNLHALFLMYHMTTHFAGLGLTLRQLLDWAFFVKAHGQEVDWEWLEQVLERFGMRRLYDILNTICVENLGFSVNIFPRVQLEPYVKDRVLQELLEPEYKAELPQGLFRSWLYRWYRWKAGAWKRQLCYNETNWTAFWRSLRWKM